MREKRLVRCPRCGSAARGEDERCPRCGALLGAPLAAPPLATDPSGVPVQAFVFSLAGPPVAPEPFAHPDRLDLRPRERPRILSYGVVRPLARRKRAGLVSILALVGLVISGLGIGVWAQATGAHAFFTLPFFAAATQIPPPATATATVPIACPLATVDLRAARALTNAQLTTGVRDAARQDFRPIDATTRFVVGQQAYVTFKIATAQPGVAGVSFCAPSGSVPGTLEIPAGSQERYAQFSTRFALQDAGSGVVTLTWNGAVAASLPFTVDPPAIALAP